MPITAIPTTTGSDAFSDWMQQIQAHIESALNDFLPSPEHNPQTSQTQFHAAMRYAVLNGGKRIRPLLVFAAGQLLDGGHNEFDVELTRAACAIEMMHAYSLVHDDMPCLDNDALRRGKPTVHVSYGEATALLVGDALQAQAFLILAQGKNPPARQLEMLQILAYASGASGMCGGQALDLANVGRHISREQLEQMHQLKTGALLRAAVLLGALCGSGPELKESARVALGRYSNAIGLAFQVVDDMLDVTADSTALGKTAGKDATHNKPTYVSILGLDASKLLAENLRIEAHDALQLFATTQPGSSNSAVQRLSQLADFIVRRSA